MANLPVSKKVQGHKGFTKGILFCDRDLETFGVLRDEAANFFVAVISLEKTSRSCRWPTS